jgi:hypothetical protein
MTSSAAKGTAFHVPPSPRGRAIFLGAWTFAAVVVSIVTLTSRSSVIQPLRILSALGPLPALLLYQAFGTRHYEERPIPSVGFPEVTRRKRFWIVERGRETPSAIAVVASAETEGTEGESARILCLRGGEAKLWIHPGMVFQYSASCYAMWYVLSPPFYAGPCLLLPAAWLCFVLTMAWLLIKSPWRFIHVGKDGCWVDGTPVATSTGMDIGRISGAAPDGDGLLMMLASGATTKLQFPGGSLSPLEQQTIALDLLRRHGIPTTTDAPGDTGPYRQGK